ncbi:FAD-binding oxidoreductase [bacterium]|jgi:FAD/FMN-containing dehydrogenase/Fe-S oxidoreductase|nr:FAD-binding oxidoreductase [bacterium]
MNNSVSSSVSVEILSQYNAFISDLRETAFSGEIRTDYASRIVGATDNSIYQTVPQAVVFPKSTEDIQLVMALSEDAKHSDITFSPRGGGTGTNGQSLNAGVQIDCSKYMRGILELNLEEKWVRVQSGVVLDQLNQYLRPHDVFFSPRIAPSSRATIGGMVSTDSCGVGSRVYGRTSQNLLGCTLVLANGEVCQVTEDNWKATNPAYQPQLDITYRDLAQKINEQKELINETFPKMKRFLTGYNLEKAIESESDLNLNYLISGAEGTLGIISEATLYLTPIPKYVGMFVLSYNSFKEGLSHGEKVLEFDPLSIELIDDTLLSLAASDDCFDGVKDMITEQCQVAQSINVVEIIGDTLESFQENVTKFETFAKQEKGESRISKYHYTTDPSEKAAIWTLRKKGVGILGNMPGSRKPIPFIEDTAVPPENLSAYIKDIKELLDGHGLKYGIYGHPDVGCLHIRPALDMRDPNDEKKVFEITDAVVQLIKKYGGVVWGEHGRGYRAEYGPEFFGPDLYELIREVKATFDPKNKINPGKVATPSGSSDQLVSIQSPLKGHFDKMMTPEYSEKYRMARECNGNGHCFNGEIESTMCPSYKATWDRIQSPKGRSQLLREWARLKSVEADTKAFSEEVYDALSGCLSCKACATGCPINVDVAALKVSFLEEYYRNKRRPVRDYLVGYLETLLPRMSKLPLAKVLSRSALTNGLLKLIGLADIPGISPVALKKIRSQQKNLVLLKWSQTEQLVMYDPKQTVILLQDLFSSYYNKDLVQDFISLCDKIDVQVIVFPFAPNGKSFLIKGMVEQFRKAATKMNQKLSKISAHGIPVVGLDPATTITYRDEYPQLLGEKFCGAKVSLPQEWLSQNTTLFQNISLATKPEPYYLVGHCTEKALVKQSQELWQDIFSAIGGDLVIQPVGCCGMAGAFGHEKTNQDVSKRIYDMNWKHWVDTYSTQLVGTGYSCAEQVKRYSDQDLKHPIQVLNGMINKEKQQ